MMNNTEIKTIKENNRHQEELERIKADASLDPRVRGLIKGLQALSRIMLTLSVTIPFGPELRAILLALIECFQ